MDAGVIMGQSTDAKIWFGLCWTEEDEKYYENGLPSVVVEHMRATYPKPEDEEDEDDECVIESAVDKLLKPLGCELVHHCYGDGATMYGLAVKDSYQCASRGYPINLTTTGTITTSTVDAKWLDNLAAAAETIGWPMKPPSWWLASYWG